MRRSVSSSVGTRTGCGRWRCVLPATRRWPRTPYRTPFSTPSDGPGPSAVTHRSPPGCTGSRSTPAWTGCADSGGDSGTAAYYPTQGDADTSGSQEDGAEDGSAGGGENDPDEQPRSLSSADDEAAAEEMADGRDGADPASPALPLLPLDGQLVLLTDLGPVQHEALTETLLQAVDEHDGTATTPARGPDLLTEAEATSCWRGLAETHSFDRYVAATAQVLLPDGRPQGDPMVALLGQHDDGSARSWVMPQECTDNPDTLPLLQGQPHG